MAGNESNDDTTPNAARNAADGSGTDATKPSLSLPSLKESVRTTVDATNRMLANLETTIGTWKEPLLRTWDTVAEQGTAVAARIADAYDQRIEYGPAIVAGTGLTAGALATMRRGGRFIPGGAIATIVVGGAAYGAIYGTASLGDVELPRSLTDRFKRE